MKKWLGLIETSEECEAETEEEAIKKMAELLIQRLQSGETKFLVWEDE